MGAPINSLTKTTPDDGVATLLTTNTSADGGSTPM